jgi:hypothetical protein
MTPEPIFKSIFAEEWKNLPPVMHKHYANRPFSHDVVTATGTMKVEIFWLARLFSPFMRIAGVLVPYAGKNIPVTVRFRSEPNTNTYTLDRVFHFSGKAPYHFCSRMLPLEDNTIIELMKTVVGWHASYRYDGKKILLEHRGYKIKLFGKLISLPLEWLLGKGYAEEEALNDDTFRMYMDLRHPLFGKVYAYSGEFSITEMLLDE